MKRKHDDVDDVAVTSTEQRMSILDISMLKLRTSPARKVEPSLRRSVLIFNTLKNIEAELKLEGVNILPNPSPELLPVIEDNRDAIDVAPCCNHGNCNHCSHSNHVLNDAVCTGQCGVLATPCNCVYRHNPTYPENQHNSGRLPCTPYQPDLSTANSHTHHHTLPAAIHTNHQSPLCFQSDLTTPSAANHATYNPPSSSQSHHSFHYNATTSIQSNDSFHGSASSCSMSMSVTESLFSDTSKMLDSFLSNDKLVAAANAASLFDMDSTGLGSTVANSNHTVCSSNHLNDSSNVSHHWVPRECAPMTMHCSDWNSTAVPLPSTDSNQSTSTYQQLNTASCTSGYTSCTMTSSSTVSHANTPSLTCRQESTATNATLGDIDCNMFDFDMFMPSLSPSMKLTPLNHDDLAHSLPSTEMPFSAPSWAPKSDHMTDDLDHIMQILVGL